MKLHSMKFTSSNQFHFADGHLIAVTGSVHVLEGASPRQRLSEIRVFIPRNFQAEWDQEIASRLGVINLDNELAFSEVVGQLRDLETMGAIRAEMTTIPHIGAIRSQALCAHPLRYLWLICLIGADPKELLKEPAVGGHQQYSPDAARKVWNRSSILGLRTWAVMNIDDFVNKSIEHKTVAEERWASTTATAKELAKKGRMPLNAGTV